MNKIFIVLTSLSMSFKLFAYVPGLAEEVQFSPNTTIPAPQVRPVQAYQPLPTINPADLVIKSPMLTGAVVAIGISELAAYCLPKSLAIVVSGGLAAVVVATYAKVNNSYQESMGEVEHRAFIGAFMGSALAFAKNLFI